MHNAAIDESTTGKHIPALDGVRGTAILLVMLAHLFVHNPRPNAGIAIRIVAQLFAAGWVGVELFFVLSGFLITGILYDTRQSSHFFRNFYARRALRIFPLYYAFLTLMIVISAAQGYHWFAKGTVLYLTYLHTLWIAGVGYTTAPWVNINHLWSLAIEEQFYMVWPVCVFLLSTKRRIVTAALLAVAASFSLRCWEYAAGVVQVYPYATYSWTPARLDSLLLGAVLAMLVRSRWRGTVLRVAPVFLLAGAATVITLLFTLREFFPPYSPVMGTVGYPLLGLTFCGVVASSLRAGSVASRLFSSRLLRLLGRYSYGLYVYHFALHELITRRVHDALEARTHSKLVALLTSGLVVALLSLGMAAASFHFLEQPILRLKRYFPGGGKGAKLREDVELASQEAAT